MKNYVYRLIMLCFLVIPLMFFQVFAQDEIESSLAEAENNQIKNKTIIGGYGELHYSYRNSEEKEESYLDFHRFVLFFGYNFNDSWSFKAELELEHNFVENGHGELELEQAHINFTPYPFFNLQGGVLLVAAGLINETHEPPLFLSVERPLYHNVIIPTTWFGNGFAAYGKNKGFYYRLFVMEGLNGDEISLDKGIRGARGKGFYKNLVQNGNNVNFKNPLYGFYGDYQVDGLKIGLSGTYNQAINANASDSQPEETDLGLVELHGQYIAHGFFSVFEIGTILYGKHLTGLRQSLGGYVDLGYNVLETIKTPINLTIWARYSWINPAFRTETGNSQEGNRQSIWRVGASLKPIPEIAIKFDYGQVTKGSENEINQEFNFGFGYYF